MKSSILITGFLLVGASAGAGSSSALGVATCNWSQDANACELAWDFNKSPRVYYWVQKWDKHTESWQSLDSTYTDTRQIGVRAKPVESGALYRVLGCDDMDAMSNCTTSTAVWAPVVPKTIEAAAAIPEHMSVSDRAGSHQTLVIDKSASLKSQTIQYNVYLLLQELEDTDYENLPPMTEPPDHENGNIANLTLEEVVHLNVYPNYAISRSQQLDDVSKEQVGSR
ncbi:MAG: hypothetical protein ACREVN_11380 [Gammaproteobacteria bacterium]